jgi:hypothetical protein
MTTKREIEALIPRVKDAAAAEALGFLVKAVGRLEREVQELRRELKTDAPTVVKKARKSNLN